VCVSDRSVPGDLWEGMSDEFHVLELALRRVSAEHSDRPMYFVFPALRRESRAGIEDSRGVSACLVPGQQARLEELQIQNDTYSDRYDEDSRDRV
jgi:hypothetical protein